MSKPKYSPQEALNRVKLMMKYDTSKTLTENKNIISEQDFAAKTAIGAGTGAGVGALVGAGLPSSLPITAAGTGAVGTGAASGMIYGLSGALGVSTATAAGIVGGAAALALTPIIVWYMDKDNAKPKVQRIIQYCTSDAQKIAKVQRGISDTEIRNLSDTLFDAMEGVGTDEEKVYNVFKGLKTASDFCALVNRYSKDYGDLLEWLDDDFDQTSEWEQIFRPIRNVVEDTLLSIKDDKIEEDCKKNPNQEKCKVVTPRKKGESKYVPCSGTYKLYCKSPKIGEVQACLGGLKVDNAFGPLTAAKLKEKGFGESFTDADISKICEKKPIENKPEIGGEIEQISVEDL
jgi:hypothetical protein